MSVTFNTGSNFAEGVAILNPIFRDIVSEAEGQVGLVDEMSKYGFSKEEAITPEGKITSLIGATPFPEIDEDEESPLMTQMQGFEKGYKIKIYSKKHKCTDLFRRWVEMGAVLQGADTSVVRELNVLKDGVKQLTDGRVLTYNVEMAKLLANGFSITNSFGAGSASPDGKALFATDHIIKSTNGSYSNTGTAALAEASLQAAITALKTGVKKGNGYSVKTPSKYVLMVSRALETTARKLLNTAGSQSGIYAGTGSNANLLNVFSFNGNAVEIQVLDMLGELDAQGNVIGGSNAATIWFLLNQEEAMRVKAFRFFTLGGDIMNMYKNDETDSVFVKLKTYFAVDHYNPEVIYGSTGAA